MKIPLRLALLVPALWAASVAYAAPGAAMNVTVSNSKDNTLAFKGRTDASGNFTTGALPAGTYVVQFTAANPGALKGKQFSMRASGGKRAVSAAGVPAEKFGGAGVAMKVDVAKGSPLSGTVGTGALAAASAPKENETNEPMEAVRANVKVVNGKRYVWVPGPIGSNIAGRWVEEGSEAARLSTSNRRGGDGEVLRKIQDTGGHGAASETSVAGGARWNRGQ